MTSDKATAIRGFLATAQHALGDAQRLHDDDLSPLLHNAIAEVNKVESKLNNIPLQ